jgi:teichuronic acid exporter
MNEPSATDAIAPASNRQWLTSIGWTAAGKWGTQLLSWVCSLVIARLLSPDDFGLLSMTTVFLGLVALLAEAGVGASVVNLPKLTESHLRQLNSLSIGFGGIGVVIILFSRTLIAEFFKRPELLTLLPVMSLPLLFSSLRAVPNALLQKGLRFKLLSSIEVVQSLTQTVVTLALALYGFRYWSLALGSIAGSIVSTVATLWVAGQRFERPRAADLSHFASFSSAVVIGNLSWFAYSNADFIIAGKVLGATALGYYSLAWTLAIAPSDKIAVVITKVVPGFFAKHLLSLEGIRYDVCRLSKGIALLIFPLAAGLALVADTFVAIALGPKWSPAVAPLRYLSIYLAISALFTVLPQAANSSGRPSIGMHSSLLKLLVMPAAFYIGSHWGAEGIALTWLIVGLPITIPLYIWVFRHIGLTFREYFTALRTPLIGTGLMAGAVLLTRLLSFGSHSVLLLTAQVVIGGAVYILTTGYLEPRWRHAVLSRVRNYAPFAIRPT